MNEDNCLWIGLIGFMGVLISVVDLYSCIKKECLHKKNKKSYTIIGVLVFIVALCIIVLALMFVGFISPSNKLNDIYTLLALFISLPKDFYSDLAKKYIE